MNFKKYLLACFGVPNKEKDAIIQVCPSRSSFEDDVRELLDLLDDDFWNGRINHSQEKRNVELLLTLNRFDLVYRWYINATCQEGTSKDFTPKKKQEPCKKMKTCISPDRPKKKKPAPAIQDWEMYQPPEVPLNYFVDWVNYSYGCRNVLSRLSTRKFL